MRIDPASMSRRLHKPLEQVTKRFRSVHMSSTRVADEAPCGRVAQTRPQALASSCKHLARSCACLSQAMQRDPYLRHLQLKNRCATVNSLLPVGVRLRERPRGRREERLFVRKIQAVTALVDLQFVQAIEIASGQGTVFGGMQAQSEAEYQPETPAAFKRLLDQR